MLMRKSGLEEKNCGWELNPRIHVNKHDSDLKAKRANQVVDDPTSITQPQYETNGNDGSDRRLFANPGKTLSEGDKKARGRRLGIFGFGSRATKLPDAQG